MVTSSAPTQNSKLKTTHVVVGIENNVPILEKPYLCTKFGIWTLCLGSMLRHLTRLL